MGVWQLVDWGEARTFHADITGWLRVWEAQEAPARALD